MLSSVHMSCSASVSTSTATSPPSRPSRGGRRRHRPPTATAGGSRGTSRATASASPTPAPSTAGSRTTAIWPGRGDRQPRGPARPDHPLDARADRRGHPGNLGADGPRPLTTPTPGAGSARPTTPRGDPHVPADVPADTRHRHPDRGTHRPLVRRPPRGGRGPRRPPTQPPATWPRPRPTAARPSRSSTTAWPPAPASRPGPGPTARSSCGPRPAPCASSVSPCPPIGTTQSERPARPRPVRGRALGPTRSSVGTDGGDGTDARPMAGGADRPHAAPPQPRQAKGRAAPVFSRRRAAARADPYSTVI